MRNYTNPKKVDEIIDKFADMINEGDYITSEVIAALTIITGSIIVKEKTKEQCIEYLDQFFPIYRKSILAAYKDDKGTVH